MAVSALPKYAIDVHGVQVHTDREPSHMTGDTLHFKDGTSCLPKTRDNLGNAGVTFVEQDSDVHLTPQATSSVTFVTFDSNGSMAVVSGGGKYNVKIGDPQGNRGITIGNNTVQHNTFD